MWLRYVPDPPSQLVDPAVADWVQRQLDAIALALNEEVDRWEDLRTDAAGRNIDTGSGRIAYNYAELGIDFASNARFPDEVVGFVNQMPHAWREGTIVRPHIHWFQNQAVFPNWLMEHRLYKNGDPVPAAWTQSVVSNNAFTYPGSGTVLQISSFPEIDMTGFTASSFLDVKIYRDTVNGSGLFGADPYVGDALLKQYDTHYLVDAFGSRQEFIK